MVFVLRQQLLQSRPTREKTIQQADLLARGRQPSLARHGFIRQRQHLPDMRYRTNMRLLGNTVRKTLHFAQHPRIAHVAVHLYLNKQRATKSVAHKTLRHIGWTAGRKESGILHARLHPPRPQRPHRGHGSEAQQHPLAAAPRKPTKHRQASRQHTLAQAAARQLHQRYHRRNKRQRQYQCRDDTHRRVPPKLAQRLNIHHQKRKQPRHRGKPRGQHGGPHLRQRRHQCILGTALLCQHIIPRQNMNRVGTAHREQNHRHRAEHDIGLYPIKVHQRVSHRNANPGRQQRQQRPHHIAKTQHHDHHDQQHRPRQQPPHIALRNVINIARDKRRAAPVLLLVGQCILYMATHQCGQRSWVGIGRSERVNHNGFTIRRHQVTHDVALR